MLSAQQRSENDCNYQNLILSSDGVGALAGTGVVMILVTNASPQPCKLEGFPVLSMADSKQRPVPITFSTRLADLVAPHLPRKVEPLNLNEGETADFGFDFTDHPDPAPKSDCASVRYVQVQLPGQGDSNEVDLGTPALICGGHPHPEVTLSPLGAVIGT
jgi:Protein of unknown function (DUF4232)